MSNTQIWTIDFTLEDLKERAPKTIITHLGIEYTEVGPNYIKAKMPVDERTMQPAGILHGGASVVLAETLGSLAAILSKPDPNEGITVGIEIKANHVKSVSTGMVEGTVTPVKIGRRIQVWNIDIHNESGDLICSSRLTTMTT